MSRALPQYIAGQLDTDSTKCWLWKGSQYVNGYGRIWWDGRQQRAHRVVFELVQGPIPEGLELDHLCRVRHCVNPEHLEPVTRRENWRRGTTSGAVALRTGRCIHGHDLSDSWVNPKGHRQCRTCHRKRLAARRLRAGMVPRTDKVAI